MNAITAQQLVEAVQIIAAYRRGKPITGTVTQKEYDLLVSHGIFLPDEVAVVKEET